MRVRFQTIETPCFIQRTGESTELGESQFVEIWPVWVDLEINGHSAPLQFAWDRHHHMLYVDERWKGRELLGDPAAAQKAREVALEVLRRASNRALEEA